MRTLFSASAFALLAGGLLASPAAFAQMAPTSQTTMDAATSPTPTTVNGSTTFKADSGAIVTIKSYQPSKTNAAPAPAFASLDTDGNGTIDTTEAAAYPLLSNDFQYADGSDNEAVSQSEYKNWVGQP